MKNCLRPAVNWIVAMLVALVAAPVSAADTGERFRVFYRDRWVDYLEIDGVAIHQGDIVLGDAREIARLRDGAVPRKALVIDRANLLWPAAGSGVHVVPYVYEAGPITNINQAIAQFNEQFSGVIEWAPRTTETDYVAFNLVGSSGSCFSSVGRVGGRQTIGGSPTCSVGSLLHEMGHAIGFWHTQSDAAQGSFLNIRYDIMDPRWTDQYEPQLDARTLDGYDYASIMHYSALVQSSTPDPLTGATSPPGIDVGLRGGYSAADVDAVRRLYGAAPPSVTVTSNPPGLEVIIDGRPVITPVTLNWRLGSLHRLDVSPATQTQSGFRFGFGRWSHDPSPNPLAAQEVVVDPGQGFLTQPITVPKNGVLTANFVRLIAVTPSVAGSANGAITATPDAAPWPGTTNYFPQYTKFTLEARTNPGFLHTWLTSSFFTMTGGGGGVPTATRRLAPAATMLVGGTIFNGPALQVLVAGPGVDGSLRANVTPPAATSPTSTLVPNVLHAAPSGNYTIAVDQTQARSDSVRFALNSIAGLDVPETGVVALPDPGQPAKVVTINVVKQFQPLLERHPACGGFVGLPSTPWLPFGSTLTAIASSLPSGVVFAGWGGTMSGTGAVSMPMTLDRPPRVVAWFNKIAEPLRLFSVTPSTYARGQGPQTFRFTGSGFTSGTFLSKESGEQKAGTLIDSHTFEITLNDADFTRAGKTVLTLGTTISPGCNAFSDEFAIEVLPLVVAQNVTVHEFYNASLDRYFRTASDAEAAAIRSNPATGERDTGQPFKAWSGLAYPSAARPVFRFYGSVTPGPNSHFFTVDVDEARLLQRAELDTPASVKRWNYEELSFAIRPAQNGGCPPEVPVRIYRVYNNGFALGKDSNHRLLTDFNLYTEMITSRGWLGEGVVMCGPS
jgi:hypothetical protein